MLAPTRPLALHLADDAATAALGQALALALLPGDTVLLSGPLGAGKSALARAVIRTLLGDAEAEVPSPSYTLVNVYETPSGPVWHADLYRLGVGGEELAELGLDEAEGRAILLVEWPERLGGAPPARHLEIALTAAAGGGRNATIRFRGPGWARAGKALEALR